MAQARPGWFQIEELYAAIDRDPEGVELVLEIETAEGRLPMVVAGRAELDVMLGHLQGICDRLGRPVRVLKFTRVGMVGELRPGGTT